MNFMTFAPTALVAAAAVTLFAGAAQATPASDFERGLADRTTYETWFASQTPEHKAGATFWASQRSLPRPAACETLSVTERVIGCVLAKARLDPTDVLRKGNPDYRLGWNAWTVPTTPAPIAAPAPAAQTVPPREIANGAVRAWPMDGTYVLMGVIGKIEQGEDVRFDQVVKEIAHDYPNAKVAVALNSPGGNVVASVNMAAEIAQYGFSVMVGERAVCASSCFLLFSAGSQKLVMHRSRIGVHAASNDTGDESGNTMAATMILARTYRQVGVPVDIIGRMVTTGPDEVAWLTPVELNEMHVTWLD